MINILKKNISIAAGLAFFVSMGGIGYLTIVRENIRAVRKPVYLPVILSTADHMKIGSAVNVLGVPYGIIGSLHYVLIDQNGEHHLPDRIPEAKRYLIRGQYVLAVLDLIDDIELYDNYRIFTRYPAIVSEKVVEINPGRKLDGEAFDALKYSTAETIRLRTEGIVPPEGGAVMATALNFDDPLYTIASVVRENRKAIRMISSSLENITDKINRNGGTIARIVNDPILLRRADDLLNGTGELVGDGRDALEALRETRQPIDFLAAYIVRILLLAAGGPPACAADPILCQAGF
jgi:hypothetical protein